MASYEIVCQCCSDTLQVKKVEMRDDCIRLTVIPCRCAKFEVFRTLDYIKGEVHRMFEELAGRPDPRERIIAESDG